MSLIRIAMYTVRLSHKCSMCRCVTQNSCHEYEYQSAGQSGTIYQKHYCLSCLGHYLVDINNHTLLAMHRERHRLGYSLDPHRTVESQITVIWTDISETIDMDKPEPEPENKLEVLIESIEQRKKQPRGPRLWKYPWDLRTLTQLAPIRLEILTPDYSLSMADLEKVDLLLDDGGLTPDETERYFSRATFPFSRLVQSPRLLHSDQLPDLMVRPN